MTLTLYPIAAGDHVGPYRITGTYPHVGYRAVDAGDGTRVHIDVSPAVDWRERSLHLLRAMQIAGALDHPGIARLHGRGVLPDRRPWIASELADGVPLCELLARRLLTPDETLELVRDLAEIVAHAHARRIVHGAIRSHLIVMRTGDKTYPLQLGGWGDLELGEDRGADIHAIGALAYRAISGAYPQPLPELLTGIAPAAGALILQLVAKQLTALEALAIATRLLGDRVRTQPRARVRWTPVPLADGERVADIIDLASHRSDRS